MPTKIGLQEFERQAIQILQAIKESMGEYIITDHGQPIALLRSVTPEDQTRWQAAEVEAELVEMKSLAQQIGAAWKSSESGVSLVDGQRR
jgi:antitoxin (DNA-binding transcriptional repressor) of toxin-antitoxin stability system